MPQTQQHALNPIVWVFLGLAAIFVTLDATLSVSRAISTTASIVLAAGAVFSGFIAWLHWRWDM